MPRGVYDRIPGKKSKAQLAGNLPPNKYAKSSFGKRQGNSSREQKQNVATGGQNNQRKVAWLKNLVDLGYEELGSAPNYAVQSVLSLIPCKEVHEAILMRNKGLPNGFFSPVVHLGFSSWLEIFMNMDEHKMRTQECLMILQKIFQDTQELLADRTDLDDVLAMEFKLGVTFLEKKHGLQDRTFDEEEVVAGQQNGITLDDSELQGFAKFIPKEDIELIKKESEAKLKDGNQENLVRLTLHNCMRFPIISEMAVEWLGEEFQQGLWRSQNYGIVAPISVKAWRLMGGITDKMMKDVENSANNMVKIMDKVEVNMPFGNDLCGKKCNNANITVFLKAHMGYLDIDRNYSYLHRIWRSFSPYYKCNCQAACSEAITWFDQAIWYAFNHLELIYPKLSQAGRMGSFMHFIQTNLRKPILAQLVYLQVKDMMIKITNRLAANPECDLKFVFGDTKLVEACELMLKDRDFLVDFYKKKDTNNIEITQVSSGGTDSFFPPRVARQSMGSSGKSDSCTIVDKPAEESDTIVSCTPGDYSVSKTGRLDTLLRNFDGKQTKLQY